MLGALLASRSGRAGNRCRGPATSARARPTSTVPHRPRAGLPAATASRCRPQPPTGLPFLRSFCSPSLQSLRRPRPARPPSCRRAVVVPLPSPNCATTSTGVGSPLFGNSEPTRNHPPERSANQPHIPSHLSQLVTGPESQWFRPFSPVTALVTPRHSSPPSNTQHGRHTAWPEWEPRQAKPGPIVAGPPPGAAGQPVSEAEVWVGSKAASSHTPTTCHRVAAGSPAGIPA